MAELEYISVEEARARLLVAYRRAGDGDFLEALQRPFTHPIEQRDERGNRKAHPLLTVGLVLLFLTGAAMTFFSFHG
jgi:hypothetical protein